MARPIKETPILKGKDAERFSRIIKENETKKVPVEDYERARKAYYGDGFKIILPSDPS